MSTSLLKRLSKKINISNYASIPLPEVQLKLRESRTKYKQFVPNAYEERKEHLEHLAGVYASAGIKTKEAALKHKSNL